ncbi:hypothetical protein FACS189459_3380 [Bacilli bacterium]|nr:hypothetical protein FACS189459_3380 [Bacilli bacterium]
MVELKALFLHIFSKNNKLKVTIINRLEKNTFNGKILPCETTCKFYEVVINGN